MVLLQRIIHKSLCVCSRLIRCCKGLHCSMATPLFLLSSRESFLPHLEVRRELNVILHSAHKTVILDCQIRKIIKTNKQYNRDFFFASNYWTLCQQFPSYTGEIVFGQRSNAVSSCFFSCTRRFRVCAQHHHAQTLLKFAAYRLTALNRMNGNSFFLLFLKGHFIDEEAGFWHNSSE